MNPVIHFEMPYDDRARMAAFYRSAFGWKFELLGPAMNDYALATTHEPKSACEPKSDGPPPTWINGGFFQRKPDWPGQQPLVVIAVESVPAAVTLVNSHGGKVLGEPMDIPGVGKYVAFVDCEGNHVCMLEPIMPAPARGATDTKSEKGATQSRSVPATRLHRFCGSIATPRKPQTSTCRCLPIQKLSMSRVGPEARPIRKAA